MTSDVRWCWAHPGFWKLLVTHVGGAQGQRQAAAWNQGAALHAGAQGADELGQVGQGLSWSHLRRVLAGVNPFILISVTVKSILCVLLGITANILV